MKMKKKTAVLLMTIFATTSILAGCSKTEADTSTTNNTVSEANTNDSQNSASPSDSSSEGSNILGQVTAINGSTITLSVFPGGGGNMPNGGKSDTQSGEKPDMQSGEAPNMQSGDKPDMQSGEAPNGQSGERPDMQSGEAPNGQSIETEEQEITISDESIITVEDGDTTKAGSLADITVGSMLQISYTTDSSGNEVLSSVVVKNMSQGAQGNEAPTTNSTESEG